MALNVRGYVPCIVMKGKKHKDIDPSKPGWLINEIYIRGYRDGTKKGNPRIKFKAVEIKHALEYMVEQDDAEYDPWLEAMSYEALKKANGGKGWDGKPRIEHVPDLVLEAGRCKYARWAGRYLYIAAIQRAMEPGCDLQEMPLFIGEGHIGKSALVRAVFPRKAPDWWVNCNFSLNPRVADYNKKAVEDTIRCVSAEFSEMTNVKIMTIEAVKSFLTQAIDYVALKWCKIAREYPRRYYLVGTANPGKPLPDDTAMMRRVVVVSCKAKDNKHLARAFRVLHENTLQCWLEAWEKYHGGYRAGWGKSEAAGVCDEEHEELLAHNLEYRDTDDWKDRILEHQEAILDTKWKTLHRIAEIISVDISKRGYASRLKKCLIDMGFSDGYCKDENRKTYRAWRLRDKAKFDSFVHKTTDVHNDDTGKSPENDHKDTTEENAENAPF